MNMNTPDNQRIIRIAGGSIFLSPDESLPLGNTTLDPAIMRFRPGKEFYWLAEIVSYKPGNGAVTLQVLDYNAADISGFENQKIRRPVKSVQFEMLNWKKLESQLAFYQSRMILGIIATETDDDWDDDSDFPEIGSLEVHEAYETIVIDDDIQMETPAPESKESIRETVYESFSHAFTDAVFDTGCVRVIKKFRWSPDPVSITIENSYILPEFDLIKSFFYKMFSGRKRFEVKAAFHLEDGIISRIEATSPQIAAINETMIEGVKRAQVLQFIRKQPYQTDKSLFTADEFMELYTGDDRKGNALSSSEMDILMAALGGEELRNRKQIEYLAGKLQSPAQKIRFTLKPDFGFVFFTEGATMNHFCWELLNSHATYLWSFSKNAGKPERQFAKVETIIASIRETGREQYKSSYRYLPPDPDMHFSLIYHKNAGSDFIDPFPEWKHRLLERLI